MKASLKTLAEIPLVNKMTEIPLFTLKVFLLSLNFQQGKTFKECYHLWQMMLKTK